MTDPTELPYDGGQSLRELRERQLMTQAEFATQAKVSTRTVCKAENGGAVGRIPRRKMLYALGVPQYRHRQYFGPLPRRRGLRDD